MKADLQHCFDRGVPVVGVTTADPNEVVETALELIDAENNPVPVVQHTTGCGFSPMNDQAENMLATALGGEGGGDPMFAGGAPDYGSYVQPADALKTAREFAEGAILVMVHAHRWLDDMFASSALWACRELFAATSRMVILTGPSLELPTELSTDIILIDNPLPTQEDAKEVVERFYSDAKKQNPDLPDVEKRTVKNATEAMTGLSRFAIEQTVAYAIKKDGLALEDLWTQKIKTIEQTRGLKIWTKPVQMAQVGGLVSLKQFLMKIIPAYGAGGVWWIDEIEKQFGGLAGDNTGVTQDQLGVLLTYMQDNGVMGILIVGPPGGGKSYISKAAGSLTNLTIAVDLGSAKGSLVGQSEATVRQMIKVGHSMCNDKPFVIATCNSISAIPPELKRRFNLGIYFVDLPDAEERAAIWQIKVGQYGIMEYTENDLQNWVSDSDGWTGAEIETACRNASLTGESIQDAMAEVLPVSVSDPETLKNLRNLAHDRFKAASYDGTYINRPQTQRATGRKLRVN